MGISIGPSIRLGVKTATPITFEEENVGENLDLGIEALDPVRIPATIVIHDGEDMYYLHVQSSPASTWTITHNLGARPNIDVLDSSDNEIIADVHHVNTNVAVVTFPSPATGKAVCS